MDDKAAERSIGWLLKKAAAQDKLPTIPSTQQVTEELKLLTTRLKPPPGFPPDERLVEFSEFIQQTFFQLRIKRVKEQVQSLRVEELHVGNYEAESINWVMEELAGRRDRLHVIPSSQEMIEELRLHDDLWEYLDFLQPERLEKLSTLAQRIFLQLRIKSMEDEIQGREPEQGQSIQNSPSLADTTQFRIVPEIVPDDSVSAYGSMGRNSQDNRHLYPPRSSHDGYMSSKNSVPTFDESTSSHEQQFISVHLPNKIAGAAVVHCPSPQSFVSSEWATRNSLKIGDTGKMLTWNYSNTRKTYDTLFYLSNETGSDFILGEKCRDEKFNRDLDDDLFDGALISDETTQNLATISSQSPPEIQEWVDNTINISNPDVEFLGDLITSVEISRRKKMRQSSMPIYQPPHMGKAFTESSILSTSSSTMSRDRQPRLGKPNTPASTKSEYKTTHTRQDSNSSYR